MFIDLFVAQIYEWQLNSTFPLTIIQSSVFPSLEHLKHSPKKPLGGLLHIWTIICSFQEEWGQQISPGCALSHLGELKGKQSGAING